MPGEFLCLGLTYWLGVYPAVCRELNYWRSRARSIPDPELRRHAVATHRTKRAHAEGAAAFAVLAPASRRRTVVRGLVAFQAMYDYLDTLSEQPGADLLANGWQLHAALPLALDPTARHTDYYACNPHSDDGGYLRAMVDTCRRACAELPSFPLVAPIVQDAAERARESQGYNHAVTDDVPLERVTSWARELHDGDGEFRWWELVGAAGSSLVILALLASSANARLRRAERDAISALYFPWAGALLALMDSLVDQEADAAGGTHSFTVRYASPAEAADRLALIAERSIALAGSAPNGERHGLIIAAMVAMFATEPEASRPGACAVATRVLAALGSVAVLPMLALRIRRFVGRVGRRWQAG